MSKGGRGSKPITDCVVTSFRKGSRPMVKPGCASNRPPADSSLDQSLHEESVSQTESVLGCKAASAGRRAKGGDSLASTETGTLPHSDGQGCLSAKGHAQQGRSRKPHSLCQDLSPECLRAPALSPGRSAGQEQPPSQNPSCEGRARGRQSPRFQALSLTGGRAATASLTSDRTTCRWMFLGARW